MLVNLVHEAAGNLTFPFQFFYVFSDESLGEHWIVVRMDEDQFRFFMLFGAMFLELSVWVSYSSNENICDIFRVLSCQ